MKKLLTIALAIITFHATSADEEPPLITPEYIAKHQLKIQPQSFQFDIYRTQINKAPRKVGTFEETIEVSTAIDQYRRFQKRNIDGNTSIESAEFSLIDMSPIERTLITGTGGKRFVFNEDGTVIVLKDKHTTTKIDAPFFDSNIMDYVIAVMADQPLKKYRFAIYDELPQNLRYFTVENKGEASTTVEGKTISGLLATTEQQVGKLVINSSYYVEKGTGNLLLERHDMPHSKMELVRVER